MNPLEIWPIVPAVLAIMPFFFKVELMRTKPRPDARKFVEVIFHDYCCDIFPLCRGTDAALGEKNAKRFGTVAQITDKYQALNGNNPAFFLEPERYKGTS